MRPKAPKKGKKNHRRLVSEGHLRMIRQLPCLLTGKEAEAAHISYGSLAHGKPGNAMGIKASDCYVVPLCPELHRLLDGCQHDTGEEEWWQQFDVDPIAIAQRLFAVGRNYEAMLHIVNSVEVSQAAQARILEILKGEK